MIIRVVKDNNYFLLNRTATQDGRLSYKAIGIHTYLMSKPDHWEGNETDLVNRHSDGRAAVRSGIEELIAFGYLTRVRVIDKGRVAGWRLDTYETPAANPNYVDGQAPVTLTEVVGEPECENRIVVQPECDFPLVEKPQVENRTHSNNTIEEINELQKAEQSAVGTGKHPDSSLKSQSLAEQFHALLEDLRQTKNKAAALMKVYILCFGEHEGMPDFGYLGKAARQVGGAGRLAELMWQQSTSPPKGDVLAYLMSKSKGSSYRRNDNANHERVTVDKQAINDAKEWYKNAYAGRAEGALHGNAGK